MTITNLIYFQRSGATTKVHEELRITPYVLKMQLGVPLALNKNEGAIIVLHHFIS